jgi:hypothetical protein
MVWRAQIPQSCVSFDSSVADSIQSVIIPPPHRHCNFASLHSFFFDSTCRFTLVAAILVCAFGLYRQGSVSSSGAPNPTPLLFSPVVFPVFRFDVLSNDIVASNSCIFLVYIGYVRILFPV